MVQVESRISQLRDASQTLKQSSNRIDTSLQNVHSIINYLVARGFQSPAATVFMDRYGSKKSVMDEWPLALKEFSDRLTSAADDIAAATTDTGPGDPLPSPGPGPGPDSGGTPLPVPGPGSGPGGTPGGVPGSSSGTSGGTSGSSSGTSGTSSSGTSGTSSSGRSSSSSTPDEPIVEEAPREIGVDEYVNSANRPLYNELVTKREQMSVVRSELDLLYAEREAKVQELTEFQARLAEFPGEVSPAMQDRVGLLEASIAEVDERINDAEGRFLAIQTEADAIQARLDLVKPAAGADVALIQNIEGTQTSQWIKDNTYDCVNYIVNRMAIPGHIPRDAHMWDQQAEQFRQWGITQGDVPLEGSVIVMEREHSYGHDVYGHVMYVERVDANGEVWITDNNYHQPIKLSDLTQETSGPYIKYLYFPWETRA